MIKENTTYFVEVYLTEEELPKVTKYLDDHNYTYYMNDDELLHIGDFYSLECAGIVNKKIYEIIT